MSRTIFNQPGRTHRITAATLGFAALLSACGSVADNSGGTESPASGATAAETGLQSGFEQTTWAGNVSVSYLEGYLHYTSDGLPNHQRNAQYALPDAGVIVPDAATASAGADPTVAQDYDYMIPLTPVRAVEPTDTSLGTIGVMISGAALFNPYEGDASTVATQSNFSVKDADGNDVWFLDDCAGHPTPMGQYHYHGLPTCVTSQVDAEGGPSHIIGIAFDGYPIYGDREIDGNQLTAADLDECNGIDSPTPEFPDGVYHYVLLDVADSTSSIRCFMGEVDDSLRDSMPGMARTAGA